MYMCVFACVCVHVYVRVHVSLYMYAFYVCVCGVCMFVCVVYYYCGAVTLLLGVYVLNTEDIAYCKGS